MSMKKSEMEKHCRRYDRLMSRARTAQRKGLFHKAVELALESWDHIDGMMQYSRRYKEKEFESIPAIDMVLRYAPLLLEYKTLNKFETLLKGQRRIDKNTSACMVTKLSEARTALKDAYRMWDYIEESGTVIQDDLRQHLGGDQEWWRWAAETWEKMGLLERMPEGRSYRLSLTTRMGALVEGKCSNCGRITEAPKAMLLEELSCPGCGKDCMFVLLCKATTN